jgi:tRNA pseudouridine13 synthase
MSTKHNLPVLLRTAKPPHHISDTENMSDHADESARPAKRARLDDNSAPSLSTQAPQALQAAPTAPVSAIDADLERELRAGITEYVCPDNLGFTGVLKQRYTDFLVNEIGLDGQVLHLKSTDVPRREKKGDARQAKENGNSAQNGVGKLVVEEENGDARMVDVQEAVTKTEDAPAQEETVIVPAVEKEVQVKEEEAKPEPEVEVRITISFV